VKLPSPAQALFNLTYALLEAEATLAARIVGLDPGLGVLHADQLNRDSLAADLMEPARPLVDRYLLRLVGARAFAAADFYETRQGVCRVTPPLAKELVATLPEWRQAVGWSPRMLRGCSARAIGPAEHFPLRSLGRTGVEVGPACRASTDEGSLSRGPPMRLVRRAGRCGPADVLGGLPGRGRI
jgi:hypothetical protein